MTTLRNLGRGSAIASLSAPELRRCFARKRRPTMTVTAKTQTLFLLLSLSLASCSNRSANCEDNATCKPEGGNGGTSGNASNGGTTKGGSTKGGSSSTSKAPCNGECSRNTPVCDESTNQCVGCLANKDCKTSAKPVCDPDQNACVACLKSTDCKDTAKPVCDTSTNACVACLANTDCPSATASRCDTTTNACAACQNDSDCTQISGKNACSNGTCVQCTVSNESACSGNSCNPKTSECTATLRGSRKTCQSCMADSECGTNEGSVDTNIRCIPMTFNGAAHGTGGYCLQKASIGCTNPYKVNINAPSFSGVAVDDYCGINQNVTTCEALLDLFNSKACLLESDCGSGQGGLCKNFAAASAPPDLRCTIPCSSDANCLASAPGSSCSGTTGGYCK